MQNNYNLLSELLYQEELEKVSPKLEAFRPKIIGGNCPDHIRIKGARGGRNAGGKTTGICSLIIQEANIRPIRVACLREFWTSLEESVYHVLVKTIERLRYPGWKITDKSIDSPCGSHFIFRGLKDYRSVSQIKGLDDFKYFFLDEAATITRESLNVLLPTLMRIDDAILWFAYNPEEEFDPITEKIWNRERNDAMLIEFEQGKVDNPWWNDSIQYEMELDYAYDPDEALHVWGGQPRKQGQKSVMNRVLVEAAMKRNIINPVGVDEIGVDVARYGSDRSVGFRRRGLKITKWFNIQGYDTNEVAYKVWDLADHLPDIKIKIDVGYNPGVADKLKELGAKVLEVNFGGSALDKQRFKSCADEMWFTFPIDSVDIPNDTDLRRELCGRLYTYEKGTGRKRIESKDEYKKRLKRSCDIADGILLCYYEGGKIIMSEDVRKALALRRNR